MLWAWLQPFYPCLLQPVKPWKRGSVCPLSTFLLMFLVRLERPGSSLTSHPHYDRPANISETFCFQYIPAFFQYQFSLTSWHNQSTPTSHRRFALEEPRGDMWYDQGHCTPPHTHKNPKNKNKPTRAPGSTFKWIGFGLFVFRK